MECKDFHLTQKSEFRLFDLFFLLAVKDVPTYRVPSDNSTPSRWALDGSAIYVDELLSIDFDYLSYGRAWIQVDIPMAVEDMAATVFRAMMKNPHELWINDERFGSYVDRYLSDRKPENLLVFIRPAFIITRDLANKIAVRLNIKPLFLFPTLTEDDSRTILREVKPELLKAFEFYKSLLDKSMKKDTVKEQFLSYVESDCRHFNTGCFEAVTYVKDSTGKARHKFIGHAIGVLLTSMGLPKLGNINERVKAFNAL